MKGGETAPSDEKPRLSLSYRFSRRFFRFLAKVWFREINVVDDDQLPPEGGILFITWHPNGLIDPLLINASLDGKLTTIGKHTLFKIPILGFLLRSVGFVPVERPQDSKNKEASRKRNEVMLNGVGNDVALGGQALLFPEGVTHGESDVKRVRSGAARIFLHALRAAEEKGKPLPNVVPLGLHYSASHAFRERAALVIERPMKFPPHPPLDSDKKAQDLADRAWISEVTEAITVELRRANLSKTTWRERAMIWKGRSLVYAEKQRQSGGELLKPSYAESILGARRLRAGWEYMARHQPAQTERLAKDCEHHFSNLDERDITPYDVDSRPERLTTLGFFRAVCSWIWALFWMFGLVTWGAIIGNYVPYKITANLGSLLHRRGMDTSVIGSVKVGSAMILFPLWWAFMSGLLAWSILDEASPLNSSLVSHWLLSYVTFLPAVGVFLVFLIWWPTSARLHLELYARLMRSTRQVKRWNAWNDESTDWDELMSVQRSLAARLVEIGAGLVLPGDEDWQDPPAGKDDVDVVEMRASLAA
ncbi:MAG: 1-acyl-sn-glycerol-3-phosphate acyltransferase [Candidatus Poseidonia sp.]|nr:1-acyl-sn-glycerol-3-phosphate acyltransferase [Poseidonia sp.]